MSARIGFNTTRGPIVVDMSGPITEAEAVALSGVMREVMIVLGFQFHGAPGFAPSPAPVLHSPLPSVSPPVLNPLHPPAVGSGYLPIRKARGDE